MVSSKLEGVYRKVHLMHMTDNEYRIYHADGHCITICREQADHDDIPETIFNGMIYSYLDDNFDGFKPLEIDKAIEIIKTEFGIF